jgi:hypothetical protein
MDVSDASYYIQENNENKGNQIILKKKKKKKNFEVLLKFSLWKIVVK